MCAREKIVSFVDGLRKADVGAAAPVKSSSPPPQHGAPVADPGFTKNFPSISYASNRCVPPQHSTSTSIWRAAMSKASGSPGGMIESPCVNPMRRLPLLLGLWGSIGLVVVVVVIRGQLAQEGVGGGGGQVA
ncbi:hypothetical protein KC347_g230 [Hortaea werneckii]|nr:hypothetical protein KC347_g230 [Hortaea werneckii]